jgi:hypothetical protein
MAFSKPQSLDFQDYKSTRVLQALKQMPLCTHFIKTKFISLLIITYIDDIITTCSNTKAIDQLNCQLFFVFP